MVSTKIQKICAWGGIATMTFYCIGMLLAHFLPVPSPAMPQDQVAVMFQENLLGIRLGALFMFVGAFCIMPTIGLISAFMKRIEGDMPIMAYTQLGAGSLGILFFYLPAVIFFVMALRPERSAELTFLSYDYAFILMIMASPSFMCQNLSIALAIFSDKNPQPIFPRWLAFFQLWTCVLYLGSFAIPFFHTGPFAWSGLFAFWIPAVVFFIWTFVMMATLVNAIKLQELDGSLVKREIPVSVVALTNAQVQL